jgi:hypothetical protein
VTEPAETPVTTPDALTVATAALLLLHTPPLTASANVVLAPGQTVVVPVIEPAVATPLTVIADVAVAEPHVEVTV